MRAPTDQRSPWLGLVGFLTSCFAALLVEAISMRVLGGGVPFPNFVLIALFIWSIRRPWFLNPLTLLVIGLLHDLFSGGPLGIWALAYLAAFTFARDREADGTGADFGPLMVRFGVLTAIAMAGAWGAGSISTGFLVPVLGLIGEGLLTIVLFAVLGWAFARRRERAAFF